jgi:hypothetical protein
MIYRSSEIYLWHYLGTSIVIEIAIEIDFFKWEC